MERFDKLGKAGYVGGELGQRMNDYGNGGVFNVSFLAPKYKYPLTNNEYGFLAEKETSRNFEDNKVILNREINLICKAE